MLIFMMVLLTKLKKPHIGIEWRYSHQMEIDKLREVVNSFNRAWELANK